MPSPLQRHPEWRRVGTDKLMHFVGHAGYAVTLADAFGTSRYINREAALLAVSISTIQEFERNLERMRVASRSSALTNSYTIKNSCGTLL